MNRTILPSPLAASRNLTILIALASAAIAAPQSSSIDRAAAIEQQLADRADKIAENPRDPGLLADQAAAYYFEYLAINAAGWTAILGVPNAGQRERCRRAGLEIYDHARRAEIAIEEAIFNLESSTGYADDLDLQREQRRLVEEERDRRIPFLIGVGASVRAHAGDLDEQGRRAMLRAAMDTLTTVGPRLGGPLAARAHVHAGIAAAELGRVEEARKLLDDAEAHEDAEPIVRFAARLALTTIGNGPPERNLDRLAAYPDYSRSMFHRLLIADRLFGAHKSRSLHEAVNAYAALLEARLDVPRETAREVIFARLADAVEGAPDTELPPLAIIAFAERNVRAGEPDAGAFEPLRRLLDRDDLTDLERAHAILTVARLRHRAGDLLAAADAYIRLAREHPTQPEAERVIEIGLTLAADRYRDEPAAARDVLHDGLALALESYPRLPNSDRWRYLAGRLAVNESRYDEAIRRLDAISPSHEISIDGGVLRIQALHRAAGATDDAQEKVALLGRLIASIDALRPRLEGAIADAEPIRARVLRRHSLEIRIRRASALVALGNAERSLELLAGIENEDGADGPLIAEALQARIEALQALGRVAEAQQQIDRFIEHATPVQVRWVLAPMLDLVERRVSDLRARGRLDEARHVGEAELSPLAARLDDWMSADEVRFDPALALRLAEAHRTAEQYEAALRLYDRLHAMNPNVGPVLLGRAECLYHMGVTANDESQLADAITIYRRLAANSELHEVYWQSQLRSLQILDATGRNTHQIAPQIQRLRLRDPGLGGDRFRPEFERLQNKYAR